MYKVFILSKEKLNEISFLIKKAEKRLSKECIRSYLNDKLLMWDHKKKRIFLVHDDRLKPLIEWELSIRLRGFEALPKFIEDCLEFQKSALDNSKVEETMSNLESLLHNN